MRNLIPNFIQNQYKKGNSQGNFSAFTMFIDISGFTHMTESLMERGDEGAEILSSILNDIFNPVLNAIYKRGGFVSTFAGDAFTAIFPQNLTDTTYYSIFSAQKIQTVFKQNGIQHTRFGDFELEAKIGLSVGNVEWGIVGKEEKMYFFRGEGIDGCTQAEHHAGKGDIIFDERLLEIARSENAIFDDRGNGFYRLRKTPFENEPLERRREMERISPEKDRRSRAFSMHPEVIYNFLPDSVINFKQTGEFRNAASLFISFRGISSKAELDEFTSILMRNGKRFSGYFNKMDFGDKGSIVLFVFGAPVAFENNVERALDFILSVKNDVSDFSNLQLRAGITYGKVYAGIIGGDKRCEYTIIGDVVNLSSRMMSRASFGEIWISERIVKSGKHKFVTESIGEQTFKGKTEAIPVYRLLKAKEAQQRLFDDEMIGRREELNQLVTFADPIFRQKFAGIAYIYGEAGMGKSRLAYAMQEELDKKDVRWIACPADQVLRKPFSPFIHFLRLYFNQFSENSMDANKASFDAVHNDLIEALSQSDTEDSKSEIKKELIRTQSVLGALLGLYWKDSLYEQLDAKGKYENTLTALKNLFLAQSLIKPMIIQLEDAQWFDVDSINFLKMLTRNIENYPISILATSRYGDEGDKPKFDLENIRSHEIDLNVLSDEDVKVMSEKQLGGKIDELLYGVLIEKTHANPFYIQQFLYYFQDNELLKFDGEFWHLKTAMVQLPDTINTILIARIDRLSQKVKEVVKAAAVIGREFEVRILSEVMKDNVNPEIQAAEKEQIWTLLTELQYIFKHALLRDSAYNMQLQARRRKLHKLTAEAIETLYGENLSEKYTDLALHYEKAEVSDKALEYLEKAGDQAKAIYQNEQALELYDRFLTLLPSSEFDEREKKKKQFDILINRGLVLRMIGKWKEAEAGFRDAVKYANQIEDESRIGRANGDLGWLFYLKAEHQKAMECFEKELEYSQAVEDKKEVARAYGNMAAIFVSQGNYEKAMERYKKNYELSKDIGDKKGISRSLGNMGIVYMYKGDYERAMKYYQERLALDRELEDKSGMSIVLGNMGIIYYNLGEFDKAMSHFRNARDLSQELGDKSGIAFAIGNMGTIHAEKGNYKNAMEYFRRKLDISKELGNKNEIAMAILNIGHIYKDRGEYDQAMESLEKAQQLFEDLNDKWGISMVLGEMGDIYFAQKDYEDAMSCFDRAIVIAQDLGMKYFWADYLLRKADLTFQLKRRNTAKRLNDEGLKLAEEIGVNEFIFKGNVLAAKLDYAFGNMKKAEHFLQKMLENSENKSEQAMLHYELWKLCITCGEERREVHRKRALVLYNELYENIPKFEYKKKFDELRLGESAVED